MADGPDGNPSAGGSAINLGSVAAQPTWDVDLLDQSWNPAGGQDIFDRNGFLIARITLTDTTNSSVSFLVATGDATGSTNFIIEGFVTDGVISFIPEPSSVALLGLGLIALVGYRRRK